MENESIEKLLSYDNRNTTDVALPQFTIDAWKFFHRPDVQEAYLVEEHRGHIHSTMAEYLLFSEEPRLGIGGVGELRTKSGEVVARGYGPKSWGKDIALAVTSNFDGWHKESNHPGCGGKVYHLEKQNSND
ncbi:MAG: hypothetical protein KKD75_01715 [Nanoarchaeota archaeon]|nr:hypothetical protein [Nanoarchaeota archaeon]MBU1632288.1 hypothetical protein [Nanoarchaeota archaeon]MBU1876325.1 hypothetical protein [Nanoarchaeota archaeon]